MGHIISATSRLSAYDLANEYADNARTDVAALIDWVEIGSEEVEQLREGITPGQWDEIFAAADVARVLVRILEMMDGSPWSDRMVPTVDDLLVYRSKAVKLRDLLDELFDAFMHEDRNQSRVLVAESEWAGYIEQEYKELAPEPIRETEWRPLEYIDWDKVAEDEDYSTITIDGDDYRYKTN